MGEAALPLRARRVRSGPLRLLGDDRLARMAAAGNQQAFAAIYRRHHQALYRYCRSILGSGEDARDALQNTMLKALDALPGEEREIALRPWLFRVAHNEAISLIRRRPEAAVALDEWSAISEFDGGTRERLRTLLGDLGRLPDRQRRALVMRELSGLSHEEISVALECSPAAAKQAVYEARVALHELTEGREMECEAVRRAVSAHDGRVLRRRKLRAHLRSCEGCREFRAAVSDRHRDLALLAPPLLAGASAGLLEGLIGGGHGSGGPAGLIGGGGASSVAGGAGVQAATAVVLVAVGAGAIDLTTRVTGLPKLGGDGISIDSSQLAPGSGSSIRDSGAGGKSHDDGKGSSGKKAGSKHQGDSTYAPGQAGTTPGQAGTSPGRAGTAPGRSGATPADGADPPGRAGTSPGRAATTPGRSGGTPGSSGDAPGHGGTPPGHGGTPPGH